MRALLTLLVFITALPVLAQVPVPVPPHAPFPGDPWQRPIPVHGCFGMRADEVTELTRALATERLERFAIEKGVSCALTKSSLEFAEGKCAEVSGELFARLRMSFSVNCITRTPSSKLWKTTIRYY